MRSRFFSIFVVSLVAAVACSDDGKKGVGDNCANNTDCADAICHSGICVSRNPLKNGDPCQNNGFCKSLLCSGGKCTQNALADGETCLNAEECTSNKCVSGTCGGGGSPDAAGRADAGSSRCEPGFTDCGGQCVDLKTNPLHCGKCDKPCGGTDAKCVSGECV
jgi:hypothetical protein